MSDNQTKTTLLTLKEAFGKFDETYKKRQEGNESPIPFYHSELNDKQNGGMWPGLYFLNGGTGTGKSQFAIQTALEASKKGTPVIYVSLELGIEEIVSRLIGTESKLSWSSILMGQVEDLEHQARVQRAKTTLEEVPFFPHCINANGFNPEALEAYIKGLQEKHSKRCLVVIDFLQLLGIGDGLDVRQRIQKSSYECQRIARDTGASFLMLSAVARSWYDKSQMNPKGNNAESFIGSGKESGEIEYSATGVLFLHSKDSASKIGIAKSRYSQAGEWVSLDFKNGSFTCLNTKKGALQ